MAGRAASQGLPTSTTPGGAAVMGYDLTQPITGISMMANTGICCRNSVYILRCIQGAGDARKQGVRPESALVRFRIGGRALTVGFDPVRRSFVGCGVCCAKTRA